VAVIVLRERVGGERMRTGGTRTGDLAQDELVEQWLPSLEAAAASVAAWRREHPRATLTEIERATRQRIGPVEAAMIADAVKTSPAADLAATPRSQRPRCPQCAGSLNSRGQRRRVLQTELGESLPVERSYAVCEQCGLEFFPPR
jgi:hypothetical protein